jgi:D-threo-aldose 1-dehydrogenase
MKVRSLPRTRLQLTEVGFGAAGIGNLYRAISDEEAAAAVAEAWSSGIRYFDTAPHYGLGLSERRLGAALAEYPRDEVVVSTKVGRLLVPNDEPEGRDSQGFDVPDTLRREWDLSRDGVLRSVEASLERLGMDRVDILYLHDPDVSGVEDAVQTGAAALIELRDQGVVSAVGVGTNDLGQVTRAFRETDIDTAMLAGRYTLLEQDGADAMFEAAGDRSIVAAGVFNSGLLSTRMPQAGAMYDYEPAPPEILQRAQHLAGIGERHGAPLPQLALQFPLRHDQVSTVVLGMRRPAQVRENVAHYAAEAAPEVWAEILAGRG